MPKLISGAVQADADICNVVDAPMPGADAGSGLHVLIPPDFAARILAGQQVPGCTYYTPPAGGGLIVSDRAVALLATPAVVNALTAPQQAQAALFNTKLAAAVVVGMAQVRAEEEIQ